MYTDHIEERLDKLFTRALSTVLLNITIEPLQVLDEVEVCFYANSACLSFFVWNLKVLPVTTNRYALQTFLI